MEANYRQKEPARSKQKDPLDELVLYGMKLLAEQLLGTVLDMGVEQPDIKNPVGIIRHNVGQSHCPADTAIYRLPGRHFRGEEGLGLILLKKVIIIIQ